MTACPLTPKACHTVRRELQGFLKRDARRWWDDHEDALTDLGEAELEALVAAMRSGDRLAAYQVLVESVPLSAWIGMREGNTAAALQIAERRKAAAKALAELGWLALRALAGAIFRAVGL